MEIIVAVISACFDAIPLVGKAWRLLLERDMEIELRGPHHRGLDDGRPILSVFVGKERPHIFGWFDIIITNHRTDRRELIIGGTLQLKKRHWRFWQKTLAEAPLEIEEYDATRYALTNVALEPMSPPLTLSVWAEGPIQVPLETLPSRMELVLEFRMVGPIRRIRRTIEKVRHQRTKA